MSCARVVGEEYQQRRGINKLPLLPGNIAGVAIVEHKGSLIITQESNCGRMTNRIA